MYSKQNKHCTRYECIYLTRQILSHRPPEFPIANANIYLIQLLLKLLSKLSLS